MTLAFIENGAITAYPIGAVEVRRKFPNTSFSRDIESADLSAFGVVKVENSDQPSFDFKTQKLEEGTPELIGGSWKQKWNIIALTQEEIQGIEDNQAASVRAGRNQRLSSCDWTQLPDAPVDATVWASYRQALRDITDQAGFPWEVVWPEEPA